MKRILFIGLFLLALLAQAWEVPVKIDGGTNDFFCEFPTIVRFDSTGAVYIFYHVAPNFAKLARYDGERVEILGNASTSGRKTYTPCMVVTKDNKIHMVWAEAVTRASSEYYIMYRTFQDKTWSDVVQIATLTMAGVPQSKHDPSKVDNMRLGVDSNGNLFIAYYDQTKARCFFISKYGDVITKEGWPANASVRMKFPDIAVTDDYIHVVWQHGLSGSDSYTNMWARRENKVSGNWLPMVDLKQGKNYPRSSHTPIIALDDKDNPHFIYMDDGDGPGREILYKYWNGTVLSEREFLTPNRGWWSNNCLSMFNKDTGFLTGHLTNNVIFYDWKVNGDWTGISIVNGVGGADNEWSALNKDGKVAIVSYTVGFNSVWVVTSSKMVSNDPPYAVIGADKDEPFWLDNVNFNGSNSTDADGSIVKYEWDFGDGEKAEGSQASHVFVKKYGDITIKLTVTDDKGAMNTASKTIKVKALYTAKDISSEKQLIRTLLYKKNGYVIHWLPNEKNAGYNIVSYK
ncbi:MAG: PKD domain-containing protein, partial [Syntrophus sp. (in: bacteria)]